MKYKISLSEDGTYIRIRVFEAITGDMEREFAEKAIKKAKQHKIYKYLVDVRQAPNVSSISEQYQFGRKDMDRISLDRFSKLAVLAEVEDKSHNFIETVFQNAGYICRLFVNEGSALKWLKE